MMGGTPHRLARDLLLDLRASAYDLSGRWQNIVTTHPAAPDDPEPFVARQIPKFATVPKDVHFDQDEKSFVFSEGGNVISADLATSPNYLRHVTYAAWVKVPHEPRNLAWILCQSPDYGWSRALTLNDYRLGYVSIATSRYWKSGLGKIPVGTWCHVVGVWRSDGESAVYLNGAKGAYPMANNGKSANSCEQLIIGGRAAQDSAHNAALSISDVVVYGRALEEFEVEMLYKVGRPSGGTLGLECFSTGLNTEYFNKISDFDSLDAGSTTSWVSQDCASLKNKIVELCKALPQPRSKPPPLFEAPERTEPSYWDDETGRIWHSTGICVDFLADGFEWQQTFKEAVQASQATVTQRRGLLRHGSDAPVPTLAPAAPARPRRTLARCPSDPEARAVRAAHTEALIRMTTRPGLQVRVQRKLLALFRFGSDVFATDAQCPHQGANLCEGEIGDVEDMVLGKRFYVRCKVHKFEFDLKTGNVVDGMCPPLKTYQTKIRQGPGQRSVIEVSFDSLGDEYFCDGEDSGADDF